MGVRAGVDVNVFMRCTVVISSHILLYTMKNISLGYLLKQTHILYFPFNMLPTTFLQASMQLYRGGMGDTCWMNGF